MLSLLLASPDGRSLQALCSHCMLALPPKAGPDTCCFLFLSLLTARKLVLDNVLQEEHRDTPHGAIVSYIRLGRRSADVFGNALKISLSMEGKKIRKATDDRQSAATAVPIAAELASAAHNRPLRQKLKEMLLELAGGDATKTRSVFTMNQLDHMVVEKPRTLEELCNIEVCCASLLCCPAPAVGLYCTPSCI